jgi:anti-sigma regulatory factor (Ser/Thr protein kinase)
VVRSGAAAGHHGYFHEALCYSSDEELAAVAVPFLLDGVAAGEPAMVFADEPATKLIKAELSRAGLSRAGLSRAGLSKAEPGLAGLGSGASGVEFAVGDGRPGRPAAAIRSFRELLGARVAAGAGQIRIVGELSCLGRDPTWQWWSRYESVINHAYDDFPLWGLCAYDTRRTPEPVLADVARTHPRLATPDGRHEANNAYVEPRSFRPRPGPADPLEAGAPLSELRDPTPGRARQAVHAAADGLLPAEEVDDLVVGVSEVVTNALRHGLPPVVVRLWAGAGRVVVTVTDAGTGPADPVAGLLPVHSADDRAGGRGLWITFQACDYVSLESTGSGFTARLTAGALPAASAV